MKVEILKPVVLPDTGEVIPEGREVDVPERMALDWIARGRAKPVAEKTEKEPEDASTAEHRSRRH